MQGTVAGERHQGLVRAPPPGGGTGRLIALEGVDGCGKSTQARLLAESLGAMLTFEPGDTAVGAALRRLLLGDRGRPPVPRAEALLMAADRAQHVAEVIEPALRAGQWVVTDRYTGSTLAYQGWGHGLDVDALRGVTRWAAEGREPDLTVLVDVPLAVARQRLGESGADRFERLGGPFFDRVRTGYLAQAAGDPVGWTSIDGTGSVEAVAVAVAGAVRERLGWPTAGRSEATAGPERRVGSGSPGDAPRADGPAERDR